MKKIYLLCAAACSLLSIVVSAAQVAGNFMSATRYDIQGRVVGTIAPDADGIAPFEYLATRNTYNSHGLLERTETGVLTTFPDESVTVANWSGYGFSGSNIKLIQTYEYDSYGRQTHAKRLDTAGNVKSLMQTSYDASSLVKCRAQRMNPAVFGSLPTACTLSAQGVEGPDRISQFTYNEHEQVLTEQRGLGTTLEQTYITNRYKLYTRLLEAQTDAMGSVTTLEYDDDWHRLTRRNYPSAFVRGRANTSDYNEYRYDQNGNTRYERKRNGGEINYTYDNNNRLILKDLGNNTYSGDTYYDYDLRGITKASRFGSNTGEGIINSVIDGFGRIRKTDNTLGGTTRSLNYSYDNNGNRTRVVHPDNVTINYEFDQLNRVTVAKEGNSALVNVLYNSAGKRAALLRNYNAASNSIASRTDYNYDGLQRLDTLIQDFPGTGSDLTNSFIYNSASQITEFTQTNSLYQYVGNSNRTGVYAANGLNQYATVNGQALTYDINGNLNGDSGANYQYDDENRLRTTAGSLPASNFKYDPLGRLYEVTIAGTKTSFLYDGDALVAEYNNAGTLIRRYVHGDQVDEPWVQYDDTATGSAAWRFLHADQQSSIISKSDVYGSQYAVMTYDSFGVPKDSNIGRFGYTGQIWFKELGLYHYKARAYSPKLGRFLQTDPIFYADDMNMYAYVGNDPLNKTDPTGTQQCPSFAQCYGPIYVPGYDASKVNPATIAKNQIELGKEALKTTAEVGVSAATTVVAPEVVAARIAAAGLGAERTAAILNAANKAFNKSGLSQAARAWEKHAGRPGGSFPPLTGNVAQKNATAENFVCCVLRNPESVHRELSGGALESRLPSGQGFRLETDGKFNFVDPSWNL